MPRRILTVALVWLLSGVDLGASHGQVQSPTTIPCPPLTGTSPGIVMPPYSPLPGGMLTQPPYSPTPGGMLTQPVPPTPPATMLESTQTPTAPSNAASDDDFFNSLGNRTSGFFGGNPGAGGGGLASASMVAMANTFTLSRTNVSPFIIPGLFSATQTEGVRPVDRVFLDYGYFDRFLFTATSGPSGVTPTRVGYDLNRLNVGIEKTLGNGRFSFYGRVPFLVASGNTTGRDFDGLGGMNAGLKAVLYFNPRTQSLISTGVTVTFPTARDFVAVQTRTYAFDTSSNPSLAQRFDRSVINPTFFQPWIGGVLVRDRLFVQQYLGVVISSEDRLPSLINSSTGFGYVLIQRPGARISSVTPSFDLQLTSPVSNNPPEPGIAAQTLPGTMVSNLQVPAFDSSAQRLRFSDQVVLSGSLAIGIRERTMLTLGLSLPAAGPRSFTYGTTIGLTYYY